MATQNIRGTLETIPGSEDTSRLSLHLGRPGLNLSDGRHSSTSSSSTYINRSPESSAPLSKVHTKRSGRCPSEIYHERNRLRSSRSLLPAPIEEDRASTINGEHRLDLETEQVTPVLGTDHRRENFETVIERITSNHPELVQQRLDRRSEVQRQQKIALIARRALKALRGQLIKETGHDIPSNRSKPFVRTISNALLQKENSFPGNDDLIKLAHHFYPPIGQMEVHVFDFGHNYCRHTITNVGDIELAFTSKPKEAKVRWIHASLGIGVTHSSVKELFTKSGIGPGKRFNRAGGKPWGDLYDPVLEFHHKDYFKAKRDAFLLLRNRQGLSKILDDTLFPKVENDKLRDDIEWRCDHFNAEMTFWNVMQAELPSQLSESIITGVIQWPSDGLKPFDQKITEQMFSRHPFYKKAQARLIKTMFRTFHREDGKSLPIHPH